MAKILFLTPGAIMTPEAQEALTANYPDIEVVISNPSEAVRIVQSRLHQGLEIVAGRTVTATILKQHRLPVAVVTIPITSFDIIRAIDEAKAQGKRIAVIAPAMMVLGIDYIADKLGVEIRQYAISLGQDYEEPILKAIADGAEVILGGALAVAAAKIHSLPFSLIKIGTESLLQAAQEAMQIQAALEIDLAKRVFFSTVLDYTNYGIITVDQNYSITAFNPMAQKLTRINKAVALGKHIEAILPQIQFEVSTDKARETPHHIIEINSNNLMYNSVPIIIHNKSFGAVITLQETSRIQQLEAVIRKRIYARGHIAHFQFEDIIGTSPCITSAKETAKDFAATNSSILIVGETGTGKEVFAQSIHNASKRAQKPFVAINCASLPVQLLESELFGYVAGAFTGACKEGKPGLFEVAHGGTIFLDELSEMDYVNQGRLLRVLQEKAVVRLGSYNVIPIDVRIIAASNKDLEILVKENKFRDDLYYRINVLQLELPPLKDRHEDIHLFAEKFLQSFSSELGKNFTFTPGALKALENYAWPGNIRECKNYMERIAATAKSELIDIVQLANIFKFKKEVHTHTSKEKRLIREIVTALEKTKGNQTIAAKLLGINRATLYRRMQKLNIEY